MSQANPRNWARNESAALFKRGGGRLYAERFRRQTCGRGPEDITIASAIRCGRGPEFRGNEMKGEIGWIIVEGGLNSTFSSLGVFDWDLDRMFPTPPLPEE